MNYSFNPLRIANTYGLFGSITRERLEVVVEGTGDEEMGPEKAWKLLEHETLDGEAIYELVGRPSPKAQLDVFSPDPATATGRLAPRRFPGDQGIRKGRTQSVAAGSRFRNSWSLARATRDRTVPTGHPKTSAASA